MLLLCLVTGYPNFLHYSLIPCIIMNGHNVSSYIILSNKFHLISRSLSLPWFVLPLLPITTLEKEKNRGRFLASRDVKNSADASCAQCGHFRSRKLIIPNIKPFSSFLWHCAKRSRHNFHLAASFYDPCCCGIAFRDTFRSMSGW